MDKKSEALIRIKEISRANPNFVEVTNADELNRPIEELDTTFRQVGQTLVSYIKSLESAIEESGEKNNQDSKLLELVNNLKTANEQLDSLNVGLRGPLKDSIDGANISLQANDMVMILSKVVDSIEASKQILSEKEFNPTINVQSPDVKVDVPKLDLGPIKELVGTQLPVILSESLQQIQFPTNLGVESLLIAVRDRLQTLIDKPIPVPQFPTTISVSSLPGTGFLDSSDTTTTIVTDGAIKTITQTDGTKALIITIDSTDPNDKLITRVWSYGD